MRGEQWFRCRRSKRNNGSSPRARGTVASAIKNTTRARFIPACAGNRAPGTGTGSARTWAVHPRVRGEQIGLRAYAPCTGGSSPRARGTVVGPPTHRALPRFIPACAGNRMTRWQIFPRALVHPRVRGEQCELRPSTQHKHGSSPRARGTDGPTPARFFRPRFIPACAGNSAVYRYSSALSPVHPRVRGEQLGHHECHGRHAVHPRVRGEQEFLEVYSGMMSGSSPRARGTGRRLPPTLRRERFIPACAGNRL